MKTKQKNTCNQCLKDMGLYYAEHSNVYEDSEHIFTVCENPKCPNFGLYQVSAEYFESKGLKSN